MQNVGFLIGGSIYHFAAVKNRSILHGRVFVMELRVNNTTSSASGMIILRKLSQCIIKKTRDLHKLYWYVSSYERQGVK